MRFLVDNNLSPALVDTSGPADTRQSTCGRTHCSLRRTKLSCSERGTKGGVLISADTDFGALLARQHADRPSVLLLRHATPRRAVNQARLILANLPAIEDDLTAGAVVTLSDNRLRIRRLPLPPM